MKNLLLPLMALLFAACGSEREFPAVKKLSEFKHTEFVATPQDTLAPGKNTVYSVPLLLAWQEIKKEGGGSIVIDEGNPALSRLNNSQSWKNTLQEDEYSASASVYDNGTIKAHAEFDMSLPLLAPLKDYGKELKFASEAVKTFGAKHEDYDFLDSFRILYYNNDDNFIIELLPKDPDHQIILYMTENKNITLHELIIGMDEEIKRHKKDWNLTEHRWKYFLGLEGDELLIPKINFNIESGYPDIQGSNLIIDNKRYTVEEVWQRTAFLFDEEGAEVESEAEFEVATEESTETEKPVTLPHPKKMHFNKPFLIILKRKDSANPYFAMWVDNTELITK